MTEPSTIVDWDSTGTTGILYTATDAQICYSVDYAIKKTMREMYRLICCGLTCSDLQGPFSLDLAYPQLAPSDFTRIMHKITEIVTSFYKTAVLKYAQNNYDIESNPAYMGMLRKNGLDLRHTCPGCLFGAYHDGSYNEEPAEIIMMLPCCHIVCEYPCYEISDQTKCLMCKEKIVGTINHFPQDYFEDNLESLFLLVE